MKKVKKGMIVYAKHKTVDSWYVGKVFMIDRKFKSISLKHNNNSCNVFPVEYYNLYEITGEKNRVGL